MHGHCVLGDHVAHLLDLLFETGDAEVVAGDGGLRFGQLLLQDLLLGSDSFQLLGEGLGGGLELLPLGDQFLEFEFVLHEGVLLDLLLPLELLPVLAQFLELVLLPLALGVGLVLGLLGHVELVLEALLHVLGCLPLTAYGGVLLL